MLTAPVNIAVFAAFYIVIGNASRTNAEFKAVCAMRQLDLWCYEWQKWQETAKGMAKTARSGKVGGKNGKGLG